MSSGSMLDVLVVGGGVAGLTLAVACARKGFRVEVFEKDPGPSFRRQGFNLVLSDRSAQLLEESCGLRDLRTKYDWCCDVDPWGWLPVTTRLKDVPILSRFLRGFGAVNRGQFRENLLQLCEKAGVRVVYGHTLEALQESEAEGMVTCYFDAPSGATRTARIVAGCDGIHSKTRRLTSRALELHECGSVCIRGAARDDGSLHRLAKAAPHESMLLFVSCRPGTGFNATVYDGRITWVLEIPTRLLANGVHDAIARSCGHWHPTLVRLMLVMTPSESLYTETLQDLGSNSGCSGAGRVTLLGDAAHPVTWTGGGNDAIADGVALAQELEAHGLTNAALRAHETAMGTRNPPSKALTSRRALPSFQPLRRVVWWYCWSALRPFAFLLSQTPWQIITTFGFATFELLR